MISGELKYKSRSLPLLALKEVKIKLGKEDIPLSVPVAYKTINDNSKRNDKVQQVVQDFIHETDLRAGKLHVKCDSAGFQKMARM